jgi:hypothetical protein
VSISDVVDKTGFSFKDPKKASRLSSPLNTGEFGLKCERKKTKKMIDNQEIIILS